VGWMLLELVDFEPLIKLIRMIKLIKINYLVFKTILIIVLTVNITLLFRVMPSKGGEPVVCKYYFKMTVICHCGALPQSLGNRKGCPYILPRWNWQS
jgi:hypothetical protein